MFCRIYTTAEEITQDSVFNLIASLLRKPILEGYMAFDNSFLSVESNDEYDKEKEVDFPEGFLFFKILIELEIDENNLREMKLIVAEILNFLWSKDYAAVASCPFEEELPYRGGYNQKELPWP